MRILIALMFFSAPAQAWQFTATSFCTLSKEQEGADIAVTYDPASALYDVSITTKEPWPQARVFAIQFEGGLPLTISTDRHKISGNTLSVSDTGFGNVLNGLEFNTSATAYTETAAVSFALDDIEAPMAAFRACITAPSA